MSMVLTATVPAFAAGGQTGNVSGTIVDAVAGAPIAGAKATLASPSGTYSQRTDAKGNFSFLGIPIDTYVVSFEASGFEPLGQPGLTVEGGATTNLGTIKLTKTATLTTIARVSVHSQSSAFQPNQTIPQFTVAGGQLLAAQGKSSNASLDQVLLSVPGFQTDSMGNLILQGSLVDQVRYQLDGIDFTEPGFNRNINNNFFNGISAVQVVPGAGDPSQGNAGAGVVNLNVRRGTYPGSGTFDAEALAGPYNHQINLSYGLASRDGSISDYFSFFAVRGGDQYGPFQTPEADVAAIYNNSFTAQNDFVNNFVFRFGHNKSQSLQVLYLNDFIESNGDAGGIPLDYEESDPILTSYYGGYELFAGITPTCPTAANAANPCGFPSLAQINAITGKEQGQYTTTSPQALNSLISNDANTSVLKFEYDNQFNASTYLALRYFNQSNFAEGFGTGPELESFAPILRTEQTAGGSRTGTNFELDKQAGANNLLTLSGNFTFNRPDFSSYAPYGGVYDLGGNVVDFLKPANVNQPVSAANPCPVAGGCYLQQFFYNKGGTPDIPALQLQSKYVQDSYGLGLRDQIQATSKLRLDLGVRYDDLNQGFGPNLFYADENTQPVPGAPANYYVNNYAFVDHPHFIEPRLGASYRIDTNDSFQASYGRAIVQQGGGELASPESQTAFRQFQNIPANPNFAGGGDALIGYPPVSANNCFPFLPYQTKGLNSKSQPSYNGNVANGTLTLGRPCANYYEELYASNDAFYPEVTAVQPGVFNEYDVNFSHQFKGGYAVKLAPFYRRGTQIQVITANLIDVNGTFQPGTLSDQSAGVSQTTGLSLEFNTPDKKYGLSGFVSATYINELTNTPPGSDNPNGQDFEPLVTSQSLAAHDLYRAGFVSPVTLDLGANYRFHNGIRINPVINGNIGYPYGVGLLTPYIYNGKGINLIGTNVTNQYAPNGAVQFVDPANPGSIFDPTIAATRGTPEKSIAGGELSTPIVTGNLTVEYSPPGSRSTFGVQLLNVFFNDFNPFESGINGNYYPVTTGVAAPLTGQNINNTLNSTEVPLRYSSLTPNLPYYSGISQPTEFRLYYQLAL